MKLKITRGFRKAILTQPGVVGDVQRRADQIARSAGPGHETSYQMGRTRPRATVRTATYQAMRDEATDRTLTRAFDAGRG